MFQLLTVLFVATPSSGYLLANPPEADWIQDQGNATGMDSTEPTAFKAGTNIEEAAFVSSCVAQQDEAAAQRREQRQLASYNGESQETPLNADGSVAADSMASESGAATGEAGFPAVTTKAKGMVSRIAEGISHLIPQGDEVKTPTADVMMEDAALNASDENASNGEEDAALNASDENASNVEEDAALNESNESASNVEEDAALNESNESASNVEEDAESDEIDESNLKEFPYNCSHRLAYEYAAPWQIHQLHFQELKFLRCPPGPYLNHSDPAVKKMREQRLRDALCLARARGWKGHNPKEGAKFRERGYFTFESQLWPKKAVCRTLPDEAWATRAQLAHLYRPDTSPVNYHKATCNMESGTKLEFHKSWKVASMSFPDYLVCEYDCEWHNETPTGEPVPQGSLVGAAVRDPMERWLSAVGELLERAINHFCPSGPCGTTDAWVQGIGPGSTLDKLSHTTTWYKHIQDGPGAYTEDSLPDLVSALVHDTSCNFYSYASEHLSTQANFVTQGAGRAANLTTVIKLEDMEKGLDRLYQHVYKRDEPHKCDFKEVNVQSCKPHQENVPSSKELLTALRKRPYLIEDLCLVYAQDFICFDYELPPECKGMF